MPNFPIDLCKDEEQEDFILVSSSGVLEDRDTYWAVKQAWQGHLLWVSPCLKADCGTDILMRQEEQLGKSDSPPKAVDSLKTVIPKAFPETPLKSLRTHC